MDTLLKGKKDDCTMPYTVHIKPIIREGVQVAIAQALRELAGGE